MQKAALCDQILLWIYPRSVRRKSKCDDGRSCWCNIKRGTRPSHFCKMSTSAAADADGSTTEDGWVSLPPHDGTTTHVWFFEPKLKFGNVLSKSGLENIANHQYVAGSYTALDTALNPLWMKLTNMLPLWLAPNAVTTFGGLHCGLAYYVLWQYSPNFDQPVPDWCLFLAGYCTIACEYY